jgi:hypothetical protein
LIFFVVSIVVVFVVVVVDSVVEVVVFVVVVVVEEEITVQVLWLVETEVGCVDSKLIQYEMLSLNSGV